MLPSRADHTTPVVGSPQLRLTTWTHQTRNEVAIYPDGLVVWDSPSGYQQMRLSPTGVATIWSSVLSTGLFDPQDDGVALVANVPSSSLIVNRGRQWVTVQWAKHPASWMGHVVQATPSQEQKLAAVYQLLHDPSDWSFSRDLYADPEVKQFWTSTYYLGYDRTRWNLSKLPEPIAHLVAGLSQRPCSHPMGLTATRDLIDALVEAGFKPIDNTPFDVGFNVPGTHGVSFLHISPDIPVTCGYPQ